MNIFRHIWQKLIIVLAEKRMRSWENKFAKMAVITGDYISLRAMLEGRFENIQLFLLEKEIIPRIAKRDVCIDIGANIGNHSVAFSRFFNKVYAFEPNPVVFDVLELNAKWNKGIQAICIGASDYAFRAKAIVPRGNLGAGKISEAGANNREDLIEFECARVDSCIDEKYFDRVGLIKIDTEGHEYKAIIGCMKIIQMSKPVIVFELLRKDFDGSGAQIWDFLRNEQYQYFYEVDKRIKPLHEIARKNYKMIVASINPLH